MKDKRIFFSVLPEWSVFYGAKRAILIDSHSDHLHFANDTALLRELFELSPHGVNIKLQGKSQNIIGIMEQLNDLGAGHFHNHHYPGFIRSDFQWDFPSDISNAILDIEDVNAVWIEGALRALDSVRTFSLQTRFYDPVPYKQLLDYLKKIETFSFRFSEIYIDFKTIGSEAGIEKLSSFPKLGSIVIYGSPYRKVSMLEEKKVFHFMDIALTENRCGIVTPGHFAPSADHISEAHHYNTCLNRKISIDRQGYVGNCPSTAHHYGHITEVSLKEVVEREDFRFWWGLKKDDIEVCRDCEFRYICTDCRAYLKNPKNLLSQPAKCGYNPYIGKWVGEEGFVPVEEWRNENLPIQTGSQ
jgi:SPASM domain peptide maturase of grasp-with-spasm system